MSEQILDADGTFLADEAMIAGVGRPVAFEDPGGNSALVTECAHAAT